MLESAHCYIIPILLLGLAKNVGTQIFSSDLGDMFRQRNIEGNYWQSHYVTLTILFLI